MPFQSRAQARFAFATKQPWAKEWASKTDFKHLPAGKPNQAAVQAALRKRRRKSSMTGKQVAKKKVHTGYPPEVVDKCLVTLIGCHGNKQATLRLLKEDGIMITDKTLTDWVRRKHADRYQEIREGRAAAQERLLARDMLDVAGRALEAEDLAIAKAQERLAANEETDPARAALNLARTKQIAIDKMLTLTGRPQQITETRDVTEVARALIALGVLKPPDEPISIESTVEEEST